MIQITFASHLPEIETQAPGKAPALTVENQTRTAECTTLEHGTEKTGWNEGKN